jgi:hypothetical protein
MAANATQFDLISDDPRCEPEKGGLAAEFHEFVQAQRELGGLLTPKQAARILGVGVNHMTCWQARGRITSRVVLGVRMVSGAEVLALYRQRLKEGVKIGRPVRGTPSLVDLAKEARSDLSCLDP